MIERLFGSGGDTDGCRDTPKPCRVGDHEYDPRKVHFGYFARRTSLNGRKLKVTESYWHECQVCGSTCSHHKRTIGVVAVTDDGLEVVSGEKGEP